MIRWWPWRRGPHAKVVKVDGWTFPYASARRIGRSRWRVQLGERDRPGCDPIEIDFWGTADQVLTYLQSEDESFRRVKQEAARKVQRAWMIKKNHETGRHVGSIKDCPRCKAVFGNGQIWLRGEGS